jgi:predicted acetyltransferase
MTRKAENLEYGPPRAAAELSEFLTIAAPMFRVSREMFDTYAKMAGEQNFRVFKRGSSIAGGLVMLPMGQFFGGKSVPMTGLAVVATAAEHRGKGVAASLLASCLKEMHASGTAISTLYPATAPLYRSVGYELAGSRFEIRMPSKALVFRQKQCDLDIRRIEERDEPEVADLHRRRAERTSGNLDRGPFLWRRIRTHAARAKDPGLSGGTS